MITTLFLSLMASAAETKTAAVPPKAKASYADVLETCKIRPGDVQAEPFLSEGELIGFKYTVVRAGSAYARAGFKAGDVLIEQNGVQLKKPEDIVTAFESVALGEPQRSKVRRGEKIIAFNMKCLKK